MQVLVFLEFQLLIEDGLLNLQQKSKVLFFNQLFNCLHSNVR